MKNLLAIFLLAFTIIGNAYSEELVVGVKQAEPFSYQDETGQWKGLSIDLLDAIVSTDGDTYRLVDLNTTPALLTAATDKKVDMSIAVISMTPEREEIVDFSHAYFSTSLGILSNSKASALENFFWMFKKIAIVFLLLAIGMYVVGFIIDRVDGDESIVGPHDGAWWALVTFSTTGYGDKAPTTNKGKVVASIWIIASLFLTSIFTGYVASTMTVKKLSETTTTLADLYDADVSVVAGSTAETKLAELGIEYDTTPSLAVAIENFKSGKTDVVVYDKAMLDYASKDIDDVDVWQIDNSDEYYAIALPPESKLKERINLGILKTLSTSKWKATKATYFGAE